jgi:hypothetical protein
MKMRNQFLILLALFCVSLTAQVSNRSGAFQGLLLDPQNSPVIGARILATSADTNQGREVTSNERGEFLLANLPAGPYSIKIEAPGFAGREYPEVLIPIGQTLFERITLRLASVSEKMEVVDELPVLDTSSPTAATSMGYERMEHSPSQGRNYVNFVLSAPGMAPAQGQSTGRSPAATWNVNNDSGFSSGGIRPRNNSVSIDGTDNRDETTGAIRVSVPLEMVQELRIAGTNISADLGGAAGGVVNIITRSGSNALHGHAEFIFQNEALNARNPEFGISSRPRLRRTQPGGSASGPIRRDKTFFAAAAEIYREDCDEWSEALLNLRNGFAFRAGERDYQYSAKVQHIFSPIHTGTLRYAYSLGQVNQGVQGIENHTDYSARGSSRVADHSLVGTLSSALNSNLLNSLTFQYASRDFSVTPNIRDLYQEIPGVMSFGTGPRMDQQRNEDHLEFVNGLTYIRGTHTLSLGASFHHVRFDGRLANRFNGLLIYPTYARYLAQQPEFRIQAFGNPSTNYSTPPLGFWFNERWRVRRGLTLEAGLRYDLQIMPAGLPTSKTNFAPRFGLAWSPGGASPWVFRLGAGLFFDRYPLSFLNEAIQKDGVNAYEQFTYFQPAQTFRSTYKANTDLPSTYGAKLTAGLERQINKDTTLAIEFSHVRGLNLPRIRNSAGTLPAQFLLEQNATSTFDGATFTLSRRMTSEFGYLVSYSTGRTKDNGSDYDEHPNNPLNLRSEWALSRQHQAHRVTASALFEIEALEKLSERLSHIHIVPSFTFGSGRPLPALDTSDTLRTAAYPLSARAAGLGRNPFLTPSNASLDARIFKELHWEDKHVRLQVGLETYNLLNRSNPIRLIPYYNANFRDVIEFSNARQFQLFLHCEF